MQVAVIATSIWPARAGHYGSEHQTAVLARGLEAAGHAVTFVAAAGSERVGKFLPVPCMYGYIYPGGEIRAYEWYRKDLLAQDLVIDASGTHRVSENLWFWDREEGLPTVVWNHNGNRFESPRPPALYELHGVVFSEAQKASGIASLSNQAFKMPPENVHIIPYGIETEVFRPVPNPTRDYFLFLSRPHPDKGLFAFLELAKRTPGERFVMAFDMAAPDHQMFGQQAIKDAASIPNVTYEPLNQSVERRVELMANARALVLPLAASYIEGWGLVIGEALSAGTPVITAKHGSPPEIVSGGTGALCGTEEEYLAAIRDWDTFDRGACRRLVQEKFSVGRWVERYEALYATLRPGA